MAATDETDLGMLRDRRKVMYTWHSHLFRACLVSLTFATVTSFARVRLLEPPGDQLAMHDCCMHIRTQPCLLTAASFSRCQPFDPHGFVVCFANVVGSSRRPLRAHRQHTRTRMSRQPSIFVPPDFTTTSAITSATRCRRVLRQPPRHPPRHPHTRPPCPQARSLRRAVET